MKERLHALVDTLSESEVIYALTFLSRLFGNTTTRETPGRAA